MSAVVADHRPDVYREGGKWVFRASSFGACDQSLVRQAMGQTPLPPPDVITNAYAQGVQFEPVILKGLGEYGWRMLDARACGDYGRVDDTGQLLCELPVGPQAVIRCHPDGIAQCYRSTVRADEGYETGARRVVEAKALKAGSWKEPLKKEQYAWQMSIEMAATGLRGCFLVGWKHEGRDGGELEVKPEHIDPQWVDIAPYGLGAIKARAKKLVKLIEAAEQGEVPACSWAMWPCGFWQTHDQSQGVWLKQQAGTLSDERERDARRWSFEWKKAKTMVDKWKVKEEEAREGLKSLLEEEKVEKWVGPDVKVVYVSETKVERFDRRLAEKNGVDLRLCMKESPTKAHVRVEVLK